ncbi:formylglycine-generating enzyme family protein, partial [candidate division KSB1 bacterium]|nr:formylglycine-generating enzyme family protein [candidate division KSB1 bacterium]
EEIRNKSKVEILVEHFDESWWREPTLLALGLGNPSIFEPFMAKFMISEKNNGGAADFMLRCVKETLVKNEAPLVTVLHNEKLRWQARYNAMLCLQIIGSTIAIDAVEKVLQDPRKEIAAKARDMLVEWKRIRVAEVKERDARTGLPARIFNPLEDNAEYVLIPQGSYTMGELNKKVTVKPFYLAKFTVTNRLYRKFVQDTKHREPTLWDDKKFNGADQPVVRVSWDDAVAYCDWLTKTNKDNREFRLPSEAEWEWAASRGERKYPWGNDEPDKNRANYGSNVGNPTPVGSYPSGATPDGLMDMAGNVWEWCADYYDEKSKSGRVLRGGSWGLTEYLLSCSYRLRNYPVNRGDNVGFRVSCGA